MSEDPFKQDIEEGHAFLPRFDRDGLLVCVTTEAGTGSVLMVAYMNETALAETLRTREATYWSRSRESLWRKGATSGQIQHVVSIRTDCDQDALLLTVMVGGDGGACHTGRKSCFYREVTGTSLDAIRLDEVDPQGHSHSSQASG